MEKNIKIRRLNMKESYEKPKLEIFIMEDHIRTSSEVDPSENDRFRSALGGGWEK